MASAFDLIAEISLESRAFQGSLRNVASKLDQTDKALDKTIAKSNKLGDTSATVARRYEKFGEAIQQQKARLLDNALAFQKGEISAVKFASVVTSVDKNVASLNSRLKDAKARLTELNETGLTNFQQQIQGAMAPQTTDVFKRLSSFQKGQLAMQGGDIFTQLASGTSPFQVLVQQGPQIAQIFAMGQKSSEAIATSTAAAATSQAAFAASTQASAIAQAQVATSSAATAASTEAAAASSTILGASVVSLGAILAAGLVTILAVWKATKDIEESVQKRLKYEELVTSEYNKQNILVAELAKKRAEAANERAFSQFVSTAPPELIQQSRTQALEQYNAALAKSQEIARRQQAVDSVVQQNSGDSFFGGFRLPKTAMETQERLRGERAAAEVEVQKFYDRIIALDKGLEDSNQRRADNDAKVTKFAEQVKWEARNDAQRAINEAEKKYADERKKMVEKAIEDAKKFAEQVKQAGELTRNIFSSTSQNPFVRIFNDGEMAAQRMLEATKGLGSELQKTLAGLINAQTQSNAFKQSMENALKSQGLRAEAAQFLGRAKPTLSQSIESQLRAIGAPTACFSSIDYDSKGNVITKTDPNQRARDQKIIELTRGLADSELSPALKQAAAAARIREANATDAEKTDLPATLKKQNELLDKILKEPPKLGIDINDPNNRTTIGGTSANVNARYPNR